MTNENELNQSVDDTSTAGTTESNIEVPEQSNNGSSDTLETSTENENEQELTEEEGTTTADDNNSSGSDPKSFNKRYNKLHSEKQFAEQQARLVEDQNKLLRQQIEILSATSKGLHQPTNERDPNDPIVPVRPTLESCGGDSIKLSDEIASYAENILSYAVRKANYDSNKQRTAASSYQLQIDHDNRLKESKQRYSDFDSTLNSLAQAMVPFNNNPMLPVVSEVVMKMPNSGDIAYYLGKNPEHFQRIFNLDPALAIAEIGRISNIASVKTGKLKSDSPAPPTKTAGASSALTSKVSNDFESFRASVK